ncbi:hypothetical protein V490_07203 [Pseudogymnoascus sp. VKM F-3557]|nr:hypothetical protein V490_07203 [Pseudogymnoascus sp. VKM F-3557]
MTPEQLLLIDAVLTLPKTSLEKECQRRITAINTVTAYCSVEEGVAFRRSRAGQPVPPVSVVEDEKPLRSEADIMLRHAISSVTTDKRPTIYFAYLGNPNLTIRERVVSFATPGYLTRHFMRKHIRRLGVDEPTECRIFKAFNSVHQYLLQFKQLYNQVNGHHIDTNDAKEVFKYLDATLADKFKLRRTMKAKPVLGQRYPSPPHSPLGSGYFHISD